MPRGPSKEQGDASLLDRTPLTGEGSPRHWQPRSSGVAAGQRLIRPALHGRGVSLRHGHAAASDFCRGARPSHRVRPRSRSEPAVAICTGSGGRDDPRSGGHVSVLMMSRAGFRSQASGRISLCVLTHTEKHVSQRAGSPARVMCRRRGLKVIAVGQPTTAQSAAGRGLWTAEPPTPGPASDAQAGRRIRLPPPSRIPAAQAFLPGRF